MTLAAPVSEAARADPAALRARSAVPARDPAGDRGWDPGGPHAAPRMRPSASWGRVGGAVGKDGGRPDAGVPDGGSGGGAGGGSGSGSGSGSGGGAGAGTPRKTVSVYAVKVGTQSRDPAPDVTRANTVWNQINVKISSAGGSAVTGQDLDLQDPKGVLNEYSDPAHPTDEERALKARRPGPADALHAYFVPSMSQGSRGESFWPAVSPVSAVVISDSAASDSLAHEIGHVLLNDGSHHSDPDNLMASGSIRNVGVDHIDAAQAAKI